MYFRTLIERVNALVRAEYISISNSQIIERLSFFFFL